jgi:hypothetical protein
MPSSHPLPLHEGVSYASQLCRNLGGFLLLTHTLRVHSTADPDITRPWNYCTNLVFY